MRAVIEGVIRGGVGGNHLAKEAGAKPFWEFPEGQVMQLRPGAKGACLQQQQVFPRQHFIVQAVAGWTGLGMPPGTTKGSAVQNRTPSNKKTRLRDMVIKLMAYLRICNRPL